MRVLVTRPESEAPRWVDALRARGYDAIALPLIRIAPVPDPRPVQDAWIDLGLCRAAMFVSGNAVRHFFDQGDGATWPGAVRCWSTGPGTRQALLDAGVPEGLIDSPSADAGQFDSETLWSAVAAQVRPGDRVLIVRGADAANGNNGRDWLAEQLAAAGAGVDTVVAYLRTVPAWDAGQRGTAEGLGANGAWLFSSSQAIAHLRQLLPRQDWSTAKAVATHSRIAQAAREAGFGVVCPSRPDVDAVAAALESIR